MTIAETLEHNGFTIEIHYDPHCSSPRENSNNGLFLGFTHRQYNIGDEQVDPREITLDCTCDSGEVTFDFLGEQVTRECSQCEGYGAISIRTFEDMVRWVGQHHDVVGPVLPVVMYDHGNVSYSVGRGYDRWDGGNAGLIFATKDTLKETQGDGASQPSDEDLTAWLTGEIEEYSAWASGDCYGYVIKDRNGDDVDSCWGFIGEKWAVEEAKASTPAEVEAPPVLHTLRLTDQTLDMIEQALGTRHAMVAGWDAKAEVARVQEVVRGARAGGDPEGQTPYGSVYRLTAPAGHVNAGKTFAFHLTPAALRKYLDNGWSKA